MTVAATRCPFCRCWHLDDVESVRSHITVCDDHLMREVERERDDLRERLARQGAAGAMSHAEDARDYAMGGVPRGLYDGRTLDRAVRWLTNAMQQNAEEPQESDMDTLKALLRRWGVEFTDERGDATSVVVDGGYPGFFTAFDFDAEGKFVKMGAYE